MSIRSGTFRGDLRLVTGAGRADTVLDVCSEILFEMGNSRPYGSEAQLPMPTQGTFFPLSVISNGSLSPSEVGLTNATNL